MTSMSAFNTTKMDVTMNNMQRSLGRIAERLHTDLIPAAEQDHVLAEELVGAENLERPDIAKAMEEANQVRFILLNESSGTHLLQRLFHKLPNHPLSSSTSVYKSRLLRVNWTAFLPAKKKN